jgi:hypothetical protein
VVDVVLASSEVVVEGSAMVEVACPASPAVPHAAASEAAMTVAQNLMVL